ncbi:aspartate aminotransferase family protein [Paenibacillus chondroitinus]|uniref:Aspartate aminotransferase family protein n=1 Tax=Paenibacillus chondroitinus TaxID=59842 RepID=A0ABU6D5K9_9BACL|nr:MULTISPECIES: aspartate aminotransferase family protein [Paenibacillus]MCY9660123.1 aspartate aminotransferase family protein [Paenibacillus anseongense]MEB4793018.1 aspartate aminotransferase family protein [Paenibacillus chondroitinus]
MPTKQEQQAFMKTEGDINLTEARSEWWAAQIDEAARAHLQEDEDVFLHQTLSTPCLNVLSSCEGIYVEDSQGRRIMDFHGNNVHQLGFGHPAVIEAVKQQLDQLSFCTRRYTNLPAIELANKLVALTDGALQRVLFAPGATSAIGMALKLARAVTGKYKTLSMWGAFHGASLDAISVGGEGAFRRGLGPLLPGAEHVIPFNSYRCVFDCQDEAHSLCLKPIAYVLEQDGEIGAVVIETIRNTDVQIPPVAYYKKLRELCDRYGALLIVDETATAFGRTGKMFAYQHYGIEPDMMVLGKGLGGGVFPMAALLVKEELNKAQQMSIGHYTHEKSPVGAAAGLATIRVIEEENLLEHASRMAELMAKRLKSMMETYPLIGDIRQIGLLVAVELVTDRVSKEPAVQEAERVMYSCLGRGLNFKVSKGNVLTLSPPLIITEDQLNEALDILEKSIAELA